MANHTLGYALARGFVSKENAFCIDVRKSNHNYNDHNTTSIIVHPRDLPPHGFSTTNNDGYEKRFAYAYVNDHGPFTFEESPHVSVGTMNITSDIQCAIRPDNKKAYVLSRTVPSDKYKSVSIATVQIYAEQDVMLCPVHTTIKIKKKQMHHIIHANLPNWSMTNGNGRPFRYKFIDVRCTNGDNVGVLCEDTKIKFIRSGAKDETEAKDVEPEALTQKGLCDH